MKRSTWLDGLAVFVLSLLYLRALPDCFSLFDEGIFASIADRLAHGDQLYRDVVTHYMPGSFWFLFLVFKIAGASIAALRWSLTLCASTAAVGVWFLARQHSERVPAFLAGLSPVVVCYPIWWMVSPHWYSTFAAVIVALLVPATVVSARPALWLLAAGAAAAATILFLQPVGVAVVLLTLGAVFFDAWSSTSLQTALRRSLVLAAGAALPLAAIVGYFAVAGILAAALSQTFWWSLHHYSGAFRISYGSIPFGIRNTLEVRLCGWFFALVVPSLYAVLLVVLLPRYRRHTVEPRDRSLLMVVSVSIGLLVGNLYYPDVVHLAAAAPPAFVALAVVLSRLDTFPQRGRAVALWMWTAALIAIGVTGLRRNMLECPSLVDTPRGRIAATADTAQDLREFLPYVANHVPFDASVFVYPYAPGYRFLTNRRNPTRYEYLLPYLPIAASPIPAADAHDEPELQEIASELRRTRPQFIVLGPLWSGPMLARYDTPVERYIRDSYHVVQQFHLAVLLERDAPDRSGPKIFLQR